MLTPAQVREIFPNASDPIAYAALREGIEERSIPEPNSGCWLWMLGVSASGYGDYNGRRFGLQTHRAHRVAYIAFKGDIPAGRDVCHKCDVPSCVNPDHLWLGTTQENTADRCAKGRSARGARQGTHTKPHTRLFGERARHAKLTADQVIAIRARPLGPGRAAAISRDYGLHKSTVHDILSGKTWKHLLGRVS